MSRGRHAAPKKHGPAVAAARTAMVRTGTCAVGLGLGWALVTAAVGEGHLEAFAGTEAKSERSADTSAPDKQERRVSALSEKYGCSADGLETGVVPARAVVRVDRQVRLATFDEGWAMYLGKARGTLVSVCAR